eukprot:4927018-Amphidinium_carterae.1
MTKRKKSAAKRRARRARAKNTVERTVGTFAQRLTLGLAAGEGRSGFARLRQNIPLPQNRVDREDGGEFTEDEDY